MGASGGSDGSGGFSCSQKANGGGGGGFLTDGENGYEGEISPAEDETDTVEDGGPGGNSFLNGAQETLTGKNDECKLSMIVLQWSPVVSRGLSRTHCFGTQFV